MSSHNYSKVVDFLAIPWKQHGRTYEQVDCLGLVYLWYRDVLGIDIEEFGDKKNFDNPRTMTANEVMYKRFKRTEQPEVNCVVVIPNSITSVHVGVVVEKDMLLHAPINQPSRIDRLSKAFRNKDKRYYIYEAN